MTSSRDPIVRLDHVSKSFGTHRVLDDVTLDIPKGTAFVLLGRSGTGKSVARVCIERTTPIAKPEITINGMERKPN